MTNDTKIKDVIIAIRKKQRFLDRVCTRVVNTLALVDREDIALHYYCYYYNYYYYCYNYNYYYCYNYITTSIEHLNP